MSGDTTPCKVTSVILHGVVTPVIPHGVVSPESCESDVTLGAVQNAAALREERGLRFRIQPLRVRLQVLKSGFSV